MTHLLRIYLKQQKLSVKEFAKDAPFSYGTIYRLLNGEGELTTETLRNISAHTGGKLSPHKLLKAFEEVRMSNPGFNKKVTHRVNREVVQ